jgi:hypothetical protein
MIYPLVYVIPILIGNYLKRKKMKNDWIGVKKQSIM